MQQSSLPNTSESRETGLQRNIFSGFTNLLRYEVTAPIKHAYVLFASGVSISCERTSLETVMRSSWTSQWASCWKH
ncbi:hypothetical protein C0J50_13795 [Silurus asotus]|uniref:Uncharacterized protein n=1 Tax=Silurus asotus TaxID=30991 RepID=A0AAD5B131_SILAS|nr:hypothetical protein C0J50_13795 [Silurus asotus]